MPPCQPVRTYQKFCHARVGGHQILAAGHRNFVVGHHIVLDLILWYRLPVLLSLWLLGCPNGLVTLVFDYKLPTCSLALMNGIYPRIHGYQNLCVFCQFCQKDLSMHTMLLHECKAGWLSKFFEEL